MNEIMEGDVGPKAFFEELVAGAREHAKELAGVKAVLKFDIVGLGVWRLLINGTDLQVEEGDGAAGCTFSIGADDFQRIAEGSLKPLVAVMEGKLKVTGDIALALKLSKLF